MASIFFNALQAVENGAGVSRYTEALFKEYISSYEDIEVITTSASAVVDSGVDRVTVSRSKSTLNRIYTEQLALLPLLRQYDLVHYPDYAGPILSGSKFIVTVHDLVAFDVPDKFPLRSRLWKQALLKKSISKAQMIISISAFTADRLMKLFDIPSKSIEVIHNGVYLPVSRPEKVVGGLVIDDPYILYVGTVEPRKNLQCLIRAYGLARTWGLDYKLVIAGSKGWMYEQIYQEVEHSGLTEVVIFTGRVSDIELSTLYSGAEFFAYISLYEGFGLPPLEAASYKLASILSNIPVFKEIMGASAVYVDPFDELSVARGLYRLFADSEVREEIASAAATKSREYSWVKTARQTVELYECLLSV